MRTSVVTLLTLATMAAMFLASPAHASVFRVNYSRPITADARETFEQHLDDAYTFARAKMVDHVDRSKCPIEIQFKDLEGRTGFTPKATGERCADVIMLDQKLEGDWKASVSVAHELTHVIRHQANPNEVPWLDEGLAKEIEYEFVKIWPQALIVSKPIATFENSSNIETYGALSHDYLNAFLLTHYLTVHLGDDDFIRALVASRQTGWNAIEEAAKKTGPSTGLPLNRLNRVDLWTHFAFALALNDSTIADNGLFEIDSEYTPVLVEKNQLPVTTPQSISLVTHVANVPPNTRVYALTRTPQVKIDHINTTAQIAQYPAPEYLVIVLP